MPDNRTQGNLEDFLVLLVPSHSTNRLFKHVKTSISSIPTSEILFPPQANSKATIHTWLAWQKEPGKPLGQAITNRFLDPDCLVVDEFVAWLKELFD